MPSRLLYIVGPCLLLAVTFLSADCEAQRQRRWFKRHSHIQRTLPSRQAAEAPPSQVTDEHSANESMPRVDPRIHGVPTPQRQRFWLGFAPATNLYGPDAYNSRRYDPRSPLYDPLTPYPKYIGGFHASEIHNLGIPSGQRGFRGNGLYWAPWQ